MKKKLSLAQRLQAYQLRQAGQTYDAIAKELQVTKATIWALLNRTQIKELADLLQNALVVSPELFTWLDGYAAELGMTGSQVVNILIIKERRKAEKENQ